MDTMYWKFDGVDGIWSVAAGNTTLLVSDGGNKLVVKRWESPSTPLVNGPVGLLLVGQRVHKTPAPTTKPTNPKDAVGINKINYSVIPANVLGEVALALTEGALKYGRHNYRGVGVRSSVYYDAAMRHLTAFWEGEDIDAESGLSHITKAISGLIVLRDCMMRGNDTDDRPPKSKEDWMIPLNERITQLREQYKDRNPKHYFEKE